MKRRKPPITPRRRPQPVQPAEGTVVDEQSQRTPIWLGTMYTTWSQL